ncbi:MAG: PilW family protein [Rhodobacter sp.]|nr:PilW family protein [Rhodobacter sp.]
MSKLNRQLGISLVEVLVALVISLFLLAGIVQVYTGNKQTFAFTNALAEIQENARFAMEIMSQDLRLAGEWGCIAFNSADTTNINDTLNAGNVAGYNTDYHDFVGEESIEGENGTGLNGSDTLTIRGGKPSQTNVEGPFTTSTTQNIFTDTTNTITAGDIILVARCGANDLLIAAEADILPVTSVVVGTTSDQRRINLGANKSQQFENDAMVIELQTVDYDIQNGAGGGPALFRSEFGVAQELVEGVQDMQVLYGIDNDSDQFPNQYVTADLVTDWEEVVAVRISLLMQSIEDFVTEDPQTITFNGVTSTPGDRRIRQVFTTTVALRNRIGSM